MGTRSLTFIKKSGRNICCMYTHFDGYPSGHGLDLFDFLNGYRIVNGFRGNNDLKEKVANGAGCLAAQLIAKFKRGVGGTYLYPTDTRRCLEDYVYNINIDENFNISIEVLDYESFTIFKGSIKKFGKWCKRGLNG